MKRCLRNGYCDRARLVCGPWGPAASPPDGISIQVLVTSFGGATDGWICFYSICSCGFCRRFRQRLFGVRDGARRIRCMATHHYADTNRNADRGLRSAHAGLRHPEIASGAELAKYLATLTWHNDRHPDRSDTVDLPQPGLSPIRRWGVAGALHDLRLGAASGQADEDWNRTRHRHWYLQRAGRRTDRTWWRHLDHLLPIAAGPRMCNARCSSPCCSRPL